MTGTVKMATKEERFRGLVSYYDVENEIASVRPALRWSRQSRLAGVANQPGSERIHIRPLQAGHAILVTISREHMQMIGAAIGNLPQLLDQSLLIWEQSHRSPGRPAKHAAQFKTRRQYSCGLPRYELRPHESGRQQPLMPPRHLRLQETFGTFTTGGIDELGRSRHSGSAWE